VVSLRERPYRFSYFQLEIPQCMLTVKSVQLFKLDLFTWVVVAPNSPTTNCILRSQGERSGLHQRKKFELKGIEYEFPIWDFFRDCVIVLGICQVRIGHSTATGIWCWILGRTCKFRARRPSTWTSCEIWEKHCAVVQIVYIILPSLSLTPFYLLAISKPREPLIEQI
jgi:hypothetical protein